MKTAVEVVAHRFDSFVHTMRECAAMIDEIVANGQLQLKTTDKTRAIKSE